MTIPNLQILRQDQIEQVHEYALQILSKTGVRVESVEALDIFRSSKKVKIDSHTVYFNREVVDKALDSVPADIHFYKKTGALAFGLGANQGQQTFFGTGVTNTYFQNITNHETELFKRHHMQHGASLTDLLDSYDMVSTLGIPSDANPIQTDLYATLDLYANTHKPLILLVTKPDQIENVFNLLSFLHGDIATKPFCALYVNPITPLVMNAATTDKMISAIHHGIPVIYSNYGMYGGSTPVTPGGTLVLLNAELLAGLVFSQLVEEGSKIALGILPAAFNMTNMGSRYTPTSYLLNLACAEMMHHYKIPHCGTSGSNNGWGPDLLAAGDLWMNHLTSCLGKVGCAPFIGGNFDSLAFSPSTVVLSGQIISEARKLVKGFSLAPEEVNLAEINNIGPGGNFFTSPQTLEYLTELGKNHSLWPSLNLDSWKQQGRPTTEKILIEYTSDLYAQAMKKSIENTPIIQKGEHFIQSI